MSELKALQIKISDFSNERGWDKFHSPKNLAMALSGEAGELTAIFQWLTEEESGNLSSAKQQEVNEELADIFIYLLRLSDKFQIDIVEESHKKIALNAQKYPIGKSYGVATKYTNLS